MQDHAKDQRILDHIQRLVAEEHQLYAQGSLAESDRERLKKLHIELDQYWDLLRQRRALRETGRNPDQAAIRSADIVEKYEQ